MAELNPDNWAHSHMRWLALSRWGNEGEMCPDKRIEHKHCIDQHGQDRPEIRDWKWGASP